MEHEDSECDDLGITRGRGEAGETMEWKEQQHGTDERRGESQEEKEGDGKE